MIRRMTALACTLALMAGAARAEMVDVDGSQLYYETCGTGPQAIVLIHDGVVNSASFDDMWPILCKDFSVVEDGSRQPGRFLVRRRPGRELRH
jgi:3-oxoadipate enol-lactonase